MRAHIARRGFLLVLAGGTAACAPGNRLPDGDMSNAIRPGATAVMRSSAGETLGTLALSATSDGSLRVQGTLGALPPGPHAIHLHSAGRCDAPAFEGAGGHFNPGGRSHGLDNPDGPHAGDAPNIEADGSGRAVVNVTLAAASLAPGSPGYIIDPDGVAIVIHAWRDDQRTDPSGNSGARIACGVVAAASS